MLNFKVNKRICDACKSYFIQVSCLYLKPLTETVLTEVLNTEAAVSLPALDVPYWAGIQHCYPSYLLAASVKNNTNPDEVHE